MTLDRITVDPGVMGGQPCIRRLRVPVATIVAMIGDGMTTAQIIAERPDLESDDVAAALAYRPLNRSLTRDEFNEMLGGAQPPTTDDVSITTDGRRLDSRDAVVEFFAEQEAERRLGDESPE